MPDERVVRGRLADHHGAGFAEELRPRELRGADAAALLGRGKDDHDAGRSVELLAECSGGEQDRGDAGFHIGCAAAVELVAVGLAAERIAGPGARAERHHVEVPGKAERRLAIRAPPARATTLVLPSWYSKYSTE